ncbi:putative metal ion transporter C17A12.14 [Termitomyces sp. T112]|nr:putative metal ion transporter C17A12.14 [Termitomyces sp. T112]
MNDPQEPAPSPSLTNLTLSSSPDSVPNRTEPIPAPSVRRRRSTSSDASDLTARLRHSPILARSFDPEARERQRTMDVDMAMQLSRARRETVSGSPEISPLPEHREEGEHNLHFADIAVQSDPEDESIGITPHASRLDLKMHLNTMHDASLLAHAPPLNHDTNTESLYGLPTYQANMSSSEFDFTPMEEFAAVEKATFGIAASPTPKFILDAIPRRFPPSGRDPSEAGPSNLPDQLFTPIQSPETDGEDLSRPGPSPGRQRKLSHSHPHPRIQRKGIGGKMALFENLHDPFSGGTPSLGGHTGLSIASRLSGGFGRHTTLNSDAGAQPPTLSGILNAGHDRPYRFSFYSNALAATIHARSLSELPADGQTFEQLFVGVHPEGSRGHEHAPPPFREGYSNGANNGNNGNRKSVSDSKSAIRLGPVGNNGSVGDSDDRTWWLDVLSPTDEEMKMLSKVFSIHPLTTEDIQMEETREKIELFRNYYLVCFRSFDQDQYSPTYLEPLNMYIIVFREGILSFHFRPTPHPQNVRRRIKQLKDYIAVTSDWISYALIDDITDAFGPLIQNIEYEVDSIDELVLILKEAEQSDMLRRIGTCRKKVMGLLRLMGNKADVVKGLAKRCNENWRVAPTSDIGLYLSDIQDHLITMTQNLNHYEKILSRSHSNYLAQISIEMTDANNQINDVLSKLTALGTVLIPMNLVTGLWGMNVHVPGQDIEAGYTWFISIVACLAAFALVGGYSTYRFMVSRS